MVVKFGNWSIGFGSEMRDANKKPLALIILDGWGYSSSTDGNAIALAHTPYYDYICENFPYTLLSASGESVGLREGSPGNSEAGHLSLGTGRVVRSKREDIKGEIESGRFFENEVLKEAFRYAKDAGSAVHLVGLLSDGDVHSSIDSLFALLRMSKAEGVTERVFVHGILDGRDVQQRTADVYCEMLEIKLADIGVGRIATLCGRHYAMDKEGNWDRTVRAYTLIVHGEGETAKDPVEAVRGSYLRGISDEFIQPIVVETPSGEPVAKIKDRDVVIFFNHRADRMRQLVRAVTSSEQAAPRVKPEVHAVCLTEYDRSLSLPVAFGAEADKNALAQIFAENGVFNCRLTEADKFPHVTYYFNGGIESEHPCEERIVVPHRNDLPHDAPEMGSFKVTDNLLRGLEAGENEVYIVNLAAADMQAHTGDLQKTVEAVQFLDTCLGGIVKKITDVGGTAIITSDHGNIEQMTDPQTGKPAPSHTTNPVPFHLISNELNGMRLREGGALVDVAPTMLAILGIEKPAEMTGKDLRLN